MRGSLVIKKKTIQLSDSASLFTDFNPHDYASAVGAEKNYHKIKQIVEISYNFKTYQVRETIIRLALLLSLVRIHFPSARFHISMLRE